MLNLIQYISDKFAKYDLHAIPKRYHNKFHRVLNITNPIGTIECNHCIFFTSSAYTPLRLNCEYCTTSQFVSYGNALFKTKLTFNIKILYIQMITSSFKKYFKPLLLFPQLQYICYQAYDGTYVKLLFGKWFKHKRLIRNLYSGITLVYHYGYKSVTFIL